MKEIPIKNFADLLDRIRKDTAAWTKVGFAKPWFRGQSNKSNPPLPSIFREGNDKHELHLSTNFRLVAPGLGDTPETGRIDQWLFLMQHVGLPTRLLDWTESPLAAAFFATEKAATREIENDAAIWAIDPIELNNLSRINDFPNTWKRSSVRQTIQIAWGTQNEPTFLPSGEEVLYKPCAFPIALYPSSIHPIKQSKDRASWIAKGVFGELADHFLETAKLLVWLDIEWLVCKKCLEEKGSESKRHLGREQSKEGLLRLVEWASQYYDREDLRSYKGHKALLDEFSRKKAHLRSEIAVNNFVANAQQNA